MTAREALVTVLHLSDVPHEDCNPFPGCAKIVAYLVYFRTFSTWCCFLGLILLFSVYSLNFLK